MRYPRRGSLVGWAAVSGLLLQFALPAGAAVLDELSGKWADAADGPPAMEWAKTDDGFTVSWAPPGAAATTVHFAAAGRAGVYAGTAKEGWSMMDSMFGDDGPVNPLAGGELYWARTAEDRIYLYSLAIEDKGVFQVDRYACRPDGGSLMVSMQRHTADGTADPAEYRLVRIGR